MTRMRSNGLNRVSNLLIVFMSVLLLLSACTSKPINEIYIYNQNDLEDFANSVNNGDSHENKTILLMNDITLVGEWIPIGIWVDDGENDITFSGIFDGQGYTINGLEISNELNYQGLFGISVGTIRNLRVKGFIDCGEHIGIIIGANSGIVENCYAEGSVNGTVNVGGIAGGNIGTVRNCYSNSNIMGSRSIGGVVGGNKNGGIVENCYNIGSVTSDNMVVGGVVGGNIEGTIQYCYNTGDVVGQEILIGGVVGADIGGTIRNCVSLGNIVSGSSAVGKVVGQSQGGLIEDNYSWSGLTLIGVESDKSNNGTPVTTFELQLGTIFWYSLAYSDVWEIVDGEFLPSLDGEDTTFPLHLRS